MELVILPPVGCVYVNASYPTGAFARGCEEACTCYPDGFVKCTERCTIPYFRSVHVTSGQYILLPIKTSYFWSVRLTSGQCVSLPVSTSPVWSVHLTSGQCNLLPTSAPCVWSENLTSGNCSFIPMYFCFILLFIYNNCL